MRSRSEIAGANPMLTAQSIRRRLGKFNSESMRPALFILVWLMLAGRLAAAGAGNAPGLQIYPPPPPREFRAMWIATTGNSCWPSKPGLTTAQQKGELITMLDRAAALKMNAVIFQVRPSCDAMYQSSLEPWSEYLTGVQGRAPTPFYDPLAYAIAEAHKRGLELHAWFNPFRAHHFVSVSPISGLHISRTHPELVRSYGRYLWLDPGDPAVRDYSLRVVMDVVNRYDIDGVHFDDYFYPYREKNSRGAEIDFPDDATWRKYGMSSGMSRDDWRRHNVDMFMEQVYHSIKGAKPWVKFGVSPFGIWRPQNPPSITGLDAYNVLFADSRKWLREGWCDYFAPQLYWGIEPPGQGFATLLNWWENENVQHRHVWPGLNTLKVDAGWPAAEIVNQISLTRRYPDPGQIHWNATALMRDGTLDNLLASEVYNQPALVPASPWLGVMTMAVPKLAVEAGGDNARVRWANGDGGAAANGWVVQCCSNGVWTTAIYPAGRGEWVLNHYRPGAVAVRAVDRNGNLSQPAVWTPTKYESAVPERGNSNSKFQTPSSR
jgi:uncharacterized lipoprotein YddW (UPF0748 family)